MTTEHVRLNDGTTIPQFGLGFWRVEAGAATALARSAYEIGYRHFDTAALYGNEAEIGVALAEFAEPIYLTTKLWNTEQGADATLRAFDESLRKLGRNPDLYLIHWPCPGNDRYVETWQAFIRLRDEGRVRSIGVSNFQVSHLERLIDETGVVPAVNQIEVHPWLQQDALRQACSTLGIAVQAWSPLAQGKILDDPTLSGIAAKHGRSVSDVTLAWHRQIGTVVFPKASRRERLAANLASASLTLDVDDLATIASLDCGRRLGPDPDTFN